MRTEPLDLDAACDVLYARAHIGGEAGRETCEMILFAAGVPALVAEVEWLRAALTLLVRTKACVSARNDVNARRCIDWMPPEEWCSWCQALAALHPQEPSDD